VWLFSSGPLGTSEVDAQGRNAREVAAAKETGELIEAVKARDHRMFFGAFAKGKPIGFAERVVMLMPAARDGFPVGDFRDWNEIDGWAEDIGRELAALV
jgi:menaquinone-dependent protoporphyrinogen oxidase